MAEKFKLSEQEQYETVLRKEEHHGDLLDKDGSKKTDGCNSSNSDDDPDEDDDLDQDANDPDLDGGYGWVIIIASFFNAFIIDGIGSSFGLLFPYVISKYGASAFLTSFAGSCFVALMIMGAISAWLSKRFGPRPVGMVGGLLAAGAFALSAFSTDIAWFILTYGLMAGCSCGLVFLPSILIVNSYFHRKRGIANGIITSGSGVGLLVLGPFINYLLDRYGLDGTILIMAGILLNMCVFSSLYRPHKSMSKRAKNSDDDEMLNDDSQCDSLILETDMQKSDVPLKFDKHFLDSGDLPKIAKSDQRKDILRSHGFLKYEIPRGVNEFYINVSSGSPKYENYWSSATQLPSQENKTPQLNPMYHSVHNIPTWSAHHKQHRKPPHHDHIHCDKNLNGSELYLAGSIATVTNIHEKNFMGHQSSASTEPLPKPTSHQFSSFLTQSGQLSADAPRHTVNSRSSDSHLVTRVVGKLVSELFGSRGSLSSQNRKHEHFGISSPSDDVISKIPFNNNNNNNSNNNNNNNNNEFPLVNEYSDVNSCHHDLEVIPSVTIEEFGSGDSVNQSHQISFDNERGSSSDVSATESFIDEDGAPLGYTTKQLLASPTFYVFCLGACLIQLGYPIAGAFLADYAYQFGLGSSHSAILMVLLGSSNVMGRLTSGCLASLRFDPLTLNNLALVCGAISCLLSPLYTEFWALCLLAVLFGFFLGFFPPLQPLIIVEYFGLGSLSSAFGFLTTVKGVGTMIGPPLAGWIFDSAQNYNMCFVFAGAVFLASALVHWLIPLVSRRRNKTEIY